MSKDIRVSKGLDLRLKGEAEKVIVDAAQPKTVAIRPADFHLITPKMVVKEGEKLKKGETVFYHRDNPEIKVVSPISGTLTKIERGARRKILSMTIETDGANETADFGALNVQSASPEQIKQRLLESGCWVFVEQRPYAVVASPDKTPRDIFISGFDTNPLAVDLDFALRGKEKEIQAALTAFAKLTTGAIHVGVREGNSIFNNFSDVVTHQVKGPHPAGNVGTQIAKIDPVNKGEIVWTVKAQNLAVIGEMLLTGKFNPERIVAVAGSSIENPKYIRTQIGAEVSSLLSETGLKEDNVRVISGNVLTGDKISKDGHLGYNDNLISVIPEGDDYELFGWNKPIFDKVSTSRAMTFSWLNPKKKYELNTNTNGEHRAFVMTGSYEEVFPLDIYPLQILKACKVKDLDQMEALGMYEVAPEDFALTEFICVSKQPHQKIIRDGLDLMYKEIG